MDAATSAAWRGVMFDFALINLREFMRADDHIGEGHDDQGPYRSFEALRADKLFHVIHHGLTLRLFILLNLIIAEYYQNTFPDARIFIAYIRLLSSRLFF
jgi:hypothetical protein